MLAGGSARGHDGAAQCAALQDHVRFHGGVAARVQNLAGADGNDLSHIAPHDAVMQPVIQSRTAIYGKSFSGGAVNRAQKLLHLRLSSPSKSLEKNISRKDSNKPSLIER